MLPTISICAAGYNTCCWQAKEGYIGDRSQGNTAGPADSGKKGGKNRQSWILQDGVHPRINKSKHLESHVIT